MICYLFIYMVCEIKTEIHCGRHDGTVSRGLMSPCCTPRVPSSLAYSPLTWSPHTHALTHIHSHTRTHTHSHTHTRPCLSPTLTFVSLASVSCMCARMYATIHKRTSRTTVQIIYLHFFSYQNNTLTHPKLYPVGISWSFAISLPPPHSPRGYI